MSCRVHELCGARLRHAMWQNATLRQVWCAVSCCATSSVLPRLVRLCHALQAVHTLQQLFGGLCHGGQVCDICQGKRSRKAAVVKQLCTELGCRRRRSHLAMHSTKEECHTSL